MYKLLVAYQGSPNHFETITDVAQLLDGTIVVFDTQGAGPCTLDLEEAQDLKSRLEEYPSVAFVRMEEIK